MLSEHQRERLEVEDVGDTTRVIFLDRKIMTKENVETIGENLFFLVDELGKKKIILDFQNVECLSTIIFGKFCTLQKKVNNVAGGKLVLCSIDGDIYEVFEVTKLNKLFAIAKDEEGAMELMK